MLDPTYPVFPVFAFLGIILPLIPLPWHLKAWNSGTCYYIMWASLSCLNQFVNSVVWRDNAINWAPVWCDISIRITMAASVALPASSLCINRRLYHIATSQAVVVTRSEKRRAVLVDTLICVLYPICHVVLQYVVQGHRFNIYENIGCYPALYNTLLMYFLSLMWPILIGLISATYAILTLRAFARRRLEFAQFLQTNRSLSVNHYFRLMALALTEIMCTTPLAVFVIVLNSKVSTVGPWRSWADTHLDYSRMDLYPAILWRQSTLMIIAFETTRWSSNACAFVFFAFFGFADEARKNYRAAFWIVAGLFGFKPAPAGGNKRSPFQSVGHLRQPKQTTVDMPPIYTPSTGPFIEHKHDRHSLSHDTFSLSSCDASTKVPETPISSTKPFHPAHAIVDNTSDSHSFVTSQTSGTAFLDEVTIHNPHISIPPHLFHFVPTEHYDGPVVR